MKKIIFPAIATCAMMGTSFATLTTVYNPNGSAQMIDAAITGGAEIQLPVGGQIIQGAPVACISAVTVLIVASDLYKAGSCLFSVNEAFGASAAAGTPAARIRALGDCSKVSLNFIQKGNAQGTTSTAIYVPDTFKEITVFFQESYGNKIAFYKDSDLTQALPYRIECPQKLYPYTPLSMMPHLAYLKNFNDFNQLEALLSEVTTKLPKETVEKIATRFRNLIQYNN